MSSNDRKVRAAVWQGPATGRWYVEVYRARHRTPGAEPHERSDVDAAPASEVLILERDTFADAITTADRMVGSIRMAVEAALSAGAATADRAWKGITPEDRR